jgi:ParB family transcriptional regulator, chromosome partitioning protein
MGSRLQDLAGLMSGGYTETSLPVTVESEVPQGIVPVLISVAKIRRSPFQPRTYFNPDKIEKMAAAFRQYKVRGEYPRTAILVRPVADGYELIFGEQRKLAHEQAGFAEILSFVDPHLSDDEARELALTENLLREDLNPIEKTEAILNLAAVRLQLSSEGVKQLLDKAANDRKNTDREATGNVTRNSDWMALEEFFQSLPGQITPESFRTNYLPLLKLPGDVMQALREGKLEYTKARAIARIKDDEQRGEVLLEAIDNNLSLNEIKQRILQLQASTQVQSEVPLKQQFAGTVKRLQKSSVWKDPSRQKKLQKLMGQLEELIGDEA